MNRERGRSAGGAIRTRFASGESRVHRLVRLPVFLVIVLVAALAAGGPLGCASSSKTGVIHHVRPGENLYRIGLRYGISAKRIARANGIRNERTLRVGQRLFVPGVGSTRRTPDARASSRPVPSEAERAAVRARARENAQRQSSLSFMWPAKGRLSSNFGRRSGRPHEGIDIAAKRGTPIYAAESGRVIHSGRMRGYGKVVIIKHAGAFRTVYAHASRLLVKKGAFVERGQKIALVGSTGRSTGPHLHFEIRRKETPQNPTAFLP